MFYNTALLALHLSTEARVLNKTGPRNNLWRRDNKDLTK